MVFWSFYGFREVFWSLALRVFWSCSMSWGYFGHFLGLGGNFKVSGVFMSFLGLGGILVILEVL